MSSIKFCKFHGFGNDYIVIMGDQIPKGTDLPELARSICHRHLGAGSDGIAVLTKLDGERADYFCEIVNPDGSVAGFSGNGTRCAVANLYYNERWPYPALRLETRSGIKTFSLIQTESPGHYWFEAEIGKPQFSSELVPVASDKVTESVVDMPVTADDRQFLISGVNVGNPVACIFVEDFDTEWRRYGRVLESHPAFPARANIVFVKVVDRDNIEIRIWERGAGETSASGTAASGSAILSAFTGRTERTVSVVSPGGTTEVHWRDDDEMLITGRADLAYSGEWPI
ncbi:MAG TPA: diaminopimelate epimerase [Pyrinomonadaceae bacterium]|nr:diaminopimelate epimerase [Pyrinomonadaceae bacterium]